MLVLGIDIKDLSLFLFHRLLISAELLIQGAGLSFNLVLTITVLPRFMLIHITDKLCQLIRKRQ